jgi:hypothetical protein
MRHEMEVVNAMELSPAFIVEAEGGVIYRRDVLDGGTLRVLAIAGAEVGNELQVLFKAGGFIGQAKVTFDKENLGKDLDFNVKPHYFQDSDTFDMQYFLIKGDNKFPSPFTNYAVKD